MGSNPRRVGRFNIEFQVIDRDPLMALLMLSGMLVVRAEAHYDAAVIEYTAYSDDFEEVLPGIVVPEYAAEFSEQRVEGTDAASGRVVRVFQRWVRV